MRVELIGVGGWGNYQFWTHGGAGKFELCDVVEGHEKWVCGGCAEFDEVVMVNVDWE